MSAAALRSAPLGEDADDHLNPADFQRIASLIEGEAGIKLPPGKRLMVEGRLRKRMRTLGHHSFAAYCGLLFKQDGLAAELPFLINVVTTNKTDFFREAEHFDFLESRIVPELVAARGGSRPLLKLWSAASSNGAEAYTMAMVLDDLAARRGGDFRYAILGTDISTAVLAQARRAIYPAEMIAPVPPLMQARYVMDSRRAGARREVRIVPELRRRVSFRHLNLMDTSYPFDRDVDVIFLRNVLIYFERTDQEAVVARLTGHLRAGGFLILGHSESMVGTGLAIRQVAPAIFQKN